MLAWASVPRGEGGETLCSLDLGVLDAFIGGELGVFFVGFLSSVVFVGVEGFSRVFRGCICGGGDALVVGWDGEEGVAGPEEPGEEEEECCGNQGRGAGVQTEWEFPLSLWPVFLFWVV